MEPGTTPFRWQDHLTVDASFGEARPWVERTLDSIASTPEGRALIEKAQRISAYHLDAPTRTLLIGKVIDGQSVTEGIAPIFYANGSYYNPDQGFIGLDLEQVRHLTIRTSDGHKPLGLISLTVHELFHAADPRKIETFIEQHSERFTRHIMGRIMGAEGIPTNKQATLFNALIQGPMPEGTSTRQACDIQAARYNDGIRNEEKLTLLTQALGIDRNALSLTPISGTLLWELQQQIEKNSRPALNARNEADATAFTDAYMRKYHGSYRRKDYSNGKIGAQDFGLYIQPFQCAKANLPIFDGEQVALPDGTVFRQPSITPDIRCEDVIRQHPR